MTIKNKFPGNKPKNKDPRSGMEQFEAQLNRIVPGKSKDRTIEITNIDSVSIERTQIWKKYHMLPTEVYKVTFVKDGITETKTFSVDKMNNAFKIVADLNDKSRIIVKKDRLSGDFENTELLTKSPNAGLTEKTPNLGLYGNNGKKYSTNQVSKNLDEGLGQKKDKSPLAAFKRKK